MPRTQVLALDFRAPKKGSLPSLPHVQICLRHWTSGEGNVFLSADCVSLPELQYEINTIRRDLDNIELEAKKKFAALKKRELTWGAKSA